MSELDPATREEMLLQGILNGDTTTNIEPGSRKEMLLKAILENGGGGGGGGSDAPVVVTLTPTSATSFTADKTAGEIDALLAAGKKVWAEVAMEIDGVSGTGRMLITAEIDLGSGYTTYRATADTTTGERYVFWCDLSGAESTLWGLTVESYVADPLNVYLNYDDVEDKYVASEVMGTIVGALINKRRVYLTFSLPLYQAWEYSFELTGVGRGDYGDDTIYYFAAVQLVDPNTGSLNLLSCTGGESADEWELQTFTFTA